MRRALVGSLTLTILLAGAAPAGAEPARTSNAAAYGLSATGLLPISPTITTSAAYPPGQDTEAAGPSGSPSLLTLPLGNLALAGVVGVNANAHLADDITPALSATTVGTTTFENPVSIAPVNARGLAKTAGVGLALTTADPLLNPILTLLQGEGGLLTADAVTAEAVAKCVNNQPVFETGFQVAGLGGVVGTPLDPIVQQVLDLLAGLGLVGPDAILADIIEISPGVVTPLADGVAVDGLVIDLLNGVERIVISHAEAHMPPGCGVAPPPPPQPTGPGPIAPTLAATGGDNAYLAIGLLMLGAVVAIRIVIARRPERSSI